MGKLGANSEDDTASARTHRTGAVVGKGAAAADTDAQSDDAKSTKHARIFATASANEFKSKYRGVTKHKRSGRWDARIWVGNNINRQIYLGGYDNEELAAEAHDVAALKTKGLSVDTNLSKDRYKDLQTLIDSSTLEELVSALKRRSQSFSRGASSYRGASSNASGYSLSVDLHTSRSSQSTCWFDIMLFRNSDTRSPRQAAEGPEDVAVDKVRSGYTNTEYNTLDRALTRVKDQKHHDSHKSAKQQTPDATHQNKATSSLKRSLSFSYMGTASGGTQGRKPAVAAAESSVADSVRMATAATAFEFAQAAHPVVVATTNAAVGVSGSTAGTAAAPATAIDAPAFTTCTRKVPSIPSVQGSAFTFFKPCNVPTNMHSDAHAFSACPAGKPSSTPPSSSSSWSALPATLDAIMQNSVPPQPQQPHACLRKIGDVGSSALAPVATAPMHAHKNLPHFPELSPESLPACSTTVAGCGLPTGVYNKSSELEEIAAQLHEFLQE